MTNTTNKHTFTYAAKFKSADLYTSRMIENMIEKYKLPNNEYTKIAVSSFLAYGPNNFKVKDGDFDVEILMMLLRYGVIWKYDNEPDTYRLWLPNSLLEFRTVKTDNSLPRVKTEYRTTYNDGTHTEVPEDQIVENYMTNPY